MCDKLSCTGDGFGGGSLWACGGGGGYSCISRRTLLGNETLAVAAGGGGAGSLDGNPGVLCYIKKYEI